MRLWRNHWEEGFPCPHPLLWGGKQPLEPLKFGFPRLEGKRLVTALGGIAPTGAFPVGASFLIVVGTTKELVLIGSKTLRVFASAFFKEEASPSFTS